MKTFNSILFFCSIILFPSISYALPLPEFASAAFGIGELIAILLALFTFIFPFFNKFKIKNHIGIYLILLGSLFLNIHYLGKENWFPHFANDNEEHEGMVWTESERNKDPYAIEELEAYKLLKEQENSNQFHKFIFLDARTRSETELGTATGFTKYNWADLVEHYKNDLKGKTVIVTCWTGMRGSEICSKLRSLGIDCKYLKGGLQAWTKLGLPLSLSPNVDKSQFGTMEDFENSTKYLSAKETVKLNKEGAYIIDLRSENIYKNKSIPNSINIDFNNITTNTLEYKIQTLPVSKKGFIIACFGTVSCAESPSLGWELNRLGLKYLGSYAGGIEAFNQNYNEKTSPLFNTSIMLYKGVKELGSHYIDKLNEILPNYVVFLFLATTLSAILWWTKKLSYSYFEKRSFRKLQNKDLKTQYNDLHLIQRENRFLAWQDLKLSFYSFAPLLLIVVYSYFFEITSTCFEKISFLYFNHWSDITHISLGSILPSILLTMGLYFIFFKKNTIPSISLKFIFIVITFLLSVLILKDFSYIHILVFVSTFIGMNCIEFCIFLTKKFKNQYYLQNFKNGCINLQAAYDYIPKNTKASQLSFLRQKGFHVPNGFVILASHYNKLSEKQQNKIINQLGQQFAVRSSALNEDQINSTHAGLNLSIVPAKASELMSNIRKVFVSYNQNINILAKNKEVVLLQKMINPIVSGVAFSNHPQQGGVSLIEWGYGLSGKRLEGEENSEQTIIDRAKGDVIYFSKENIHLSQYMKQIYELIHRLESICAYPVDIEWAIDKEGLWLLQVRAQTGLKDNSESTINLDKEKLLNSSFIPLKSCELSYTLPSCNRLSASLLCHLWEPGSSADKASQMALWKWNTSLKEQKSYIYALGKIWQSDYILLNKPNTINWYMAKKQFNTYYQYIKQESQDILKQQDITMAVNWNHLSEQSYLKLWNESLQHFKTMQSFAFYFEFMAQKAIEEVVKQCQKLNLDSNKLLQTNISYLYGEHIKYRSSHDYDISLPRNIENNNNLVEIENIEKETIDYTKGIYENISKNVIKKVKLAHNLIYLREVYKYNSLKIFYILRLAILNLQQRLNINNSIFEIDFKEIESLFIMNDVKKNNFITLLEKRMVENTLLHKISQIDYLDHKGLALFGNNNKNKTDYSLNKKPVFVSHSKNLIGKIIYLDSNLSINDIENIFILAKEHNEPLIIYSNFIYPQLVQLARKYNIVGLCSLYGSLLSHSSILARENNISFLINIHIDKEFNGKIIEITTEGEIKKFH